MKSGIIIASYFNYGLLRRLFPKREVITSHSFVEYSFIYFNRKTGAMRHVCNEAVYVYNELGKCIKTRFVKKLGHRDL